MSTPSSMFSSPSPEVLRKWGDGLLWSLLGLGLAGTLGLAWIKPDALLLVPLMLLGAVALSVLVRYPLLHLCMVLGGFILIFDYSEGTQASEVLFGLYYLGYLGVWFVYRISTDWSRLFDHPVDYAVAFYLLFATASLALTILFGGSLFNALKEWGAVLVLSFYFPMKEAARDPRAVRALLVTFVIVALSIVVRNFAQYFLALQDVGALWEVVQNRHRTNERLVMIGLLGALIFFLYYARTRLAYTLFLTLSVLFTASIMAGRSRTVWLAIGLALFVVFLLVNGRDRIRLLIFGATGFATVLAVGFLVLDDLFLLILTGLGDRFTSIGGATERDLSLINRFYEWRTVWAHILDSPLVGHGFGVEYDFFSRLYYVTERKTFVHNTYLGLLYRHGIVGLGLVLFFVGGSCLRGIRLARRSKSYLARSTLLTAVASIAALALAATTEAVLLPTDGVFAVMFPIALIAGIGERGVGGHPPS